MGWIKKTRDTGWRDITSTAPGHVSGRVLFRREGDRVTLAFDELVLSAAGSNSFTRLPSSLWPLYRVRDIWHSGPAAMPVGTLNISGTGYFNVYGIVPGETMGGRFEWDVNRPWATSWPGIEVQL